MARRAARVTAGYHLPQVTRGLRIGIGRFADRIPSFGAETLEALRNGTPFLITSAGVDHAIQASGDDVAWRWWRKEHPSGDPWQPGGEGALWEYDPATASLRPADDLDLTNRTIS